MDRIALSLTGVLTSVNQGRREKQCDHESLGLRWFLKVS